MPDISKLTHKNFIQNIRFYGFAAGFVKAHLFD